MYNLETGLFGRAEGELREKCSTKEGETTGSNKEVLRKRRRIQRTQCLRI
jgi:hypothetical protein